MTEPGIFTTLLGVLEEVRTSLYPIPKRVVLSPGTSVPWDGCCDGYLYAQMTQLTPLRSGTTCYGYNARARFGVLRCVSVLDDQGRPPKPAKMNTDSLVILADMETMRESLEENNCVVQVETWTPLGPEGGCAGGEWSVTLHV